MSWNVVKRKFQRDLDVLPARLRDQLSKSLTEKFSLPTFDKTVPPPNITKRERKTDFQVGITSGDLVYITTGEKKGTITTVFQYSASNDSVLLADVSEKRLIPQTQWVENQASHFIDYPKFVPREHIKLAGKERDENGKINYLVADEVEFKGSYYDERYRRWLPKRFVKHHNSIEIPWPNPVTVEDGELSTIEPVVFEKTYELQSIAKAPFPQEALGQLRNPYSKFKKRTLSELQARRLKAPEMPLSAEQKIYLAKKAQEPKKTYSRLSDEIQDFIGGKMAEHISKIDNPALLTHLDALSKSTIPDFEKTIKSIEETEQK